MKRLFLSLICFLSVACIAGGAAQAQPQLSSNSTIQANHDTGTGTGTETDAHPLRLRPRAAWAQAYAEMQTEPIVISGGVRRPLLFFREAANHPWRPGMLFYFLFVFSGLLKAFLPRLCTTVGNRCRSNIFTSLTAAFIFSTLLTALIRFAFATVDLNAMGVFLFGLLQMSFALGCCLGVNLFAHNLYTLVTSKKAPAGTIAKALLYSFCLMVVAGTLTLISLVPNLGLLPRIGNRIVMLVGALGLGGLVSLAVQNQKSDS